MSFEKVGANPPLEVAKGGDVSRADEVKQKLADVPEKVDGKVQGHSVCSFFARSFASIESRINAVTKDFANFDIGKEFIGALHQISAKILTEIPQKFHSIQSSIFGNVQQTPKRQKLGDEGFIGKITTLQRSMDGYADAILLKAPDVETHKANLQKALEEAKGVKSDNKDLSKAMQKEIRSGDIFKTSLNPERTALNFKSSADPQKFYKDMTVHNIALFSGDVMIDKKVNKYHSLENWVVLNKILAAKDPENKAGFEKLNTNITALTRFCETSEAVFGPFIENADEKTSGKKFEVLMPVPKQPNPAKNEPGITPQQITALRNTAKSQIDGAISQVKQMQEDLAKITFASNSSNQATTHVGNSTVLFLQTDLEKLMNNLVAIRGVLYPPGAR